MGRNVVDNFKKRFEGPAQIKIKSKDKLFPSYKAYRNGKTATAYADILRNLLGRESTKDEISKNVNVLKTLRRK